MISPGNATQNATKTQFLLNASHGNNQNPNYWTVWNFETEMGIFENYIWLPDFQTSLDSCFAGPTQFLPVWGYGPAGYFEDCDCDLSMCCVSGWWPLPAVWHRGGLDGGRGGSLTGGCGTVWLRQLVSNWAQEFWYYVDRSGQETAAVMLLVPGFAINW